MKSIKKIHYVYKITEIHTGYMYIGKRSSSVLPRKDSYMGSGVRVTARQKRYGMNNYKKDILATFDTEQEAYDFEEFIVDGVFVDFKNVLNINEGGRGGNTFNRETFLKPSSCIFEAAIKHLRTSYQKVHSEKYYEAAMKGVFKTLAKTAKLLKEDPDKAINYVVSELELSSDREDRASMFLGDCYTVKKNPKEYKPYIDTIRRYQKESNKSYAAVEHEREIDDRRESAKRRETPANVRVALSTSDLPDGKIRVDEAKITVWKNDGYGLNKTSFTEKLYFPVEDRKELKYIREGIKRRYAA